MTGRAHHYGVTVSDLEAALSFYRDELGLDVVDRFTVDGEAFNDVVGTAGATATFVHLDAGGCRCELIEYDTSDWNATDGVSNDDVGATHFALAVDDVRAVYDDLSDDVESISPPRTTDSGSTVVYLLDPDGNRVELIEA